METELDAFPKPSQPSLANSYRKEAEMTAKILVVDDNVYLTTLLQSMLADEGYEVSAARFAQEGYSAYLQNRPDVILTDIQMPGESGLEMMKKIRGHDPEVRTIYMSGDWLCLQSTMKEENRKSFVKSLRKPFFQGELLKVLSECLPPGRTELPQEGLLSRPYGRVLGHPDPPRQAGQARRGNLPECLGEGI
jgi:DNA-binding NtrC family response regulator